MVDAATFAKHVDSSQELGSLCESDEEPRPEKVEDFSEHLLMLCSPVLKAYCLMTKTWGAYCTKILTVRSVSYIKQAKYMWMVFLILSGMKTPLII